MTLRFFGRSDDILTRLIKHLGFAPLRPGITHWTKESRILVPYDAEGRRVPEGSRRMWLDLSDGQKVRITPGNNIQGAKQPQFMHIGNSAPGHGMVAHRDEHTSSFQLVIEGASMRLGLWWLDAAARGAIDVLPIVNLKPTYESKVPGSPAATANLKPTKSVEKKQPANFAQVQKEAKESAMDAEHDIIIPSHHVREARNATVPLEKSNDDISTIIAKTSSFDQQWDVFQKKFEDMNKLALRSFTR